MAQISNPGEEKAWEILGGLKPSDVCKAASVLHDPLSEEYRVKSFGMEFSVSIKNKTISSTAPGSAILLNRLGYFFRLSILWYLVSAKDIACTGKPVKLQHIKGGDIFTRGSHTLPLDAIAKKFGKNREGFMEKGKAIGAKAENLGDVALRIFPLPRIPVVLTLWIEDEEFPARADLFFDSTCALQVPIDIIWSIAMMTLLIML